MVAKRASSAPTCNLKVGEAALVDQVPSIPCAADARTLSHGLPLSRRCNHQFPATTRTLKNARPVETVGGERIMSRKIEFSANVRRVLKMLGPSTAASTSAELEESMAVSSKRSFGEFTASIQKELDSLFTPFQIYRILPETGNKVGNARNLVIS